MNAFAREWDVTSLEKHYTSSCVYLLSKNPN